MNGLQPVFFRRTYDEALSLVVEARNYVAFCERRDRARLGMMTRLEASREALRVTSRLTQIVAWLLLQRAIQEGEVDAFVVLDANNRLAGFDICLDTNSHENHELPKGLLSLLDRSYRLFQRVARLEEQVIHRLH
jgi:regulator of CtrA degradation